MAFLRGIFLLLCLFFVSLSSFAWGQLRPRRSVAASYPSGYFGGPVSSYGSSRGYSYKGSSDTRSYNSYSSNRDYQSRDYSSRYGPSYSSSRDYGYSSRDYSPRDYGYSSRDYGYSPRDYGHSSRDYGYSSRDYGYSSRDYGYSSRDYGYSSRDYGYSSPNYRYGGSSSRSGFDLYGPRTNPSMNNYYDRYGGYGDYDSEPRAHYYTSGNYGYSQNQYSKYSPDYSQYASPRDYAYGGRGNSGYNSAYRRAHDDYMQQYGQQGEDTMYDGENSHQEDSTHDDSGSSSKHIPTWAGGLDDSSSSGSGSTSGGPSAGCCFRVGLGATGYCCLVVEENVDEETCRSEPQAPGGSIGWAPECPSTPEEAGGIINAESTPTDSDSSVDDTSSSGSGSTSGGPSAGCCFRVGLGATGYCCLVVEENVDEETCRNKPQAPGGSIGWAPECPSTPEEAGGIINALNGQNQAPNPDSTHEGPSSSNQAHCPPSMEAWDHSDRGCNAQGAVCTYDEFCCCPNETEPSMRGPCVSINNLRCNRGIWELFYGEQPSCAWDTNFKCPSQA